MLTLAPQTAHSKPQIEIAEFKTELHSQPNDVFRVCALAQPGLNVFTRIDESDEPVQVGRRQNN